MVARGLGVSVIDPFTAEVARQGGCLVLPFEPPILYSFALIRATSAPANPLTDEFSRSVELRLTEFLSGEAENGSPARQ
jgi:hypothetical protein